MNLANKKKLTIPTVMAALSVFISLCFIIISIRYKCFSNSIYSIDSIIQAIIPIFWLFCTLGFIKIKKSQNLGIITMALVAFGYALECIAIMINNRQYSSEMPFINLYMPMIFPIILTILAVLIVFALLKKISVSILTIVAIISEFVLEIFCIMSVAGRFNIYMFTNSLQYLMWILFYFSFLTYYNKKKQNSKHQIITNPQQALSMLQSSFDSGAITEEEYNEKRAEILNSL